MTDEIKQEIKSYFKNKEYDEVVKMLNTKILVDESNYKDIFSMVLNILNSIRINRDINYHEDYIEIERNFASNFCDHIYSFFERKLMSNEKLDEIKEECARFFYAVDSVTSIGGASFSDEGDEKIK